MSLQSFSLLCASHWQRVWLPLPLVSAVCQRDSQQVTEAIISIGFGFAVFVFLPWLVLFARGCVDGCVCVRRREGLGSCIKLFCHEMLILVTSVSQITSFILQEEWNCCHKLLFNQFWRPLHDVLLQKQCFGNLVLNVAYRIKTFYQHRLLLEQFWRPPHLALQQKPSLVTQFQILNKTKVPSFTFRLRSAS